MAVYHQMGHDSWNLIAEKNLRNYAGLILSPVNDSPADVTAKLAKLGKQRNTLEVILDPQFYKPQSDRGHLASWDHFSAEVDTTDLGDTAWWKKQCKSLVSTAYKIGANTICSPTIIPKVYSDDYYRWTVNCAELLYKESASKNIGTLITAVVRLSDLAEKKAPLRIASIFTSSRIDRLYLVLFDDLGPRQQRSDFEELAGAVALIRLLEEAGTRVLVAFSGLDLILWKAAGATDAATGKFFNLRRFVPGRFEDATEGGRVVPYWTDDLLITWLREDDVRLLDRGGLIDRDNAASNPYSTQILDVLDAGAGEAWVGLGWRQYMYWFMETESAISRDRSLAHQLLITADTRWSEVVSSNIYLFDRQNTGSWIRPWLNALQLGMQP